MNTIKKIGLVSIGLATILLSGCNDDDSTDTTSTTTDVTVTRGPVMDAVVTDSTGKVGVEIAGTNIYRFQGDVSYPVTANGGWIDVDGDGVLTVTDVKLDVELKSNTNNVTPLTTYTFDEDENQERLKKEELLRILNQNQNGVVYTEDDLDDLPEEMDEDLQKAMNAIYAVSKENQNQLMERLTISEIEAKMIELEALYTYDDTISAKENAERLEEQVMEQLELNGDLDRINENDLFDMDKDVLDLSSLTLDLGETIKIYKGIPTDLIDATIDELKLSLTNVEIEDYKLTDNSLTGFECEVINAIYPNSCEFVDMSTVTPNEGIESVNLVLKIEQDEEESSLLN